jgi:hypothetical protein
MVGVVPMRACAKIARPIRDQLQGCNSVRHQVDDHLLKLGRVAENYTHLKV